MSITCFHLFIEYKTIFHFSKSNPAPDYFFKQFIKLHSTKIIKKNSCHVCLSQNMRKPELKENVLSDQITI